MLRMSRWAEESPWRIPDGGEGGAGMALHPPAGYPFGVDEDREGEGAALSQWRDASFFFLLPAVVETVSWASSKLDAHSLLTAFLFEHCSRPSH